ncbi:hypothetical protein BGZ89_011954 [Linnemannia elongata]|nr:hypothetical protein BGZ89_011954 [Linnemannia elongata]
MPLTGDVENCYRPKDCAPDPLEQKPPLRKRVPPPPPPPPAPLPVPTPSPLEPAPAPTDPPMAPAPIPDTPTLSSPPTSNTTTETTTAMATKNMTLILTSAILGSLLLLIASLLFYVCMKRRRHAASYRTRRGRVGQMQDGMPTSSSFLDADNEKGGGGGKKSSEKYYYEHQHQYHQYPVQHQIDTTSSASTLVAHPSNAHHRTRSAPIAFAFAKGAFRRHSDTSAKASSNNNNIDNATTTAVSPTTVVGGYAQMGRIGRDAFGSQFQQISLVAEEAEEDDRRSLSTGDGQGGYGYGYGFGGYGISSSSNSSRNRCKTVAVPTPVVSTLHRSVSLSTHGHPLHGPGLGSGSYDHHTHYYNSRSGAPHIDEGNDNEDDDVEESGEQLPHDADRASRHHQLRFAEGENPNVSQSSSTFPQQQQQAYPYPQHHTQHSKRYSVGLGYPHSHRGSISSAMEFDPSRFSTMSVMFDAKRLFTSSRPVSSSSIAAATPAVSSFSHPRPPTRPESDESDDDTVSTSSSDGGFDDLPPHQLSQHFESHNPYAVSTTTTANGDKPDRLHGEDDESDDESDGEAVVQGLGVGVEVRRQHGYPVYGQTISPLAPPPMPPQISPE